MKIVVELEKTETGWGAFTPEEGLCVIATGDTRGGVISQFADALRFHLDGMREEGIAPPEITLLEIRETLPLPKALAA